MTRHLHLLWFMLVMLVGSYAGAVIAGTSVEMTASYLLGAANGWLGGWLVSWLAVHILGGR